MYENKKSTSGGIVSIGKHVIKSWSATQKIVALSVGEAEYYGLVKGSSIAMGARSIMSDLGVDLSIRVKTDSTAAKGIASRTGLGKVRHIEVAQLWIQEKVRNGDITLEKVDGEINQSDCLIKYVGREDIEWQMNETGQRLAGGRHELCPHTIQS